MGKSKKNNKKKKKSNKSIFIFLIVILAIVIIGFIYQEDDESSPAGILKKYMSYIEQKDYEAMYSLVSTDKEKSEYIDRNKNIYEGIELSSISVNIVKRKNTENEAEVIYINTLNTIAGKITFTNTAHFVKENEEYKIKWSSNLIFPSLNEDYKVRVSIIEAKRGEIFDRNDKYLAQNQTASQIGLVPGKMNEETKNNDIKNIAKLLEIKEETIKDKLSAAYVEDNTFVPLKIVLKSETELKNSLLEIKGIKITDVEKRFYPLGEATSHLIGYIQGISSEELEKNKNNGYNSNSVIGKTGVESIFEDKLRAQNGAEIYITNNDGDKIKTIAKQDAKNGKDIKLTIDSNLQEEIYELFKDDKSSSVAINPKTGEILALVSTPTFNSNDFVLGIDSNKWNELSNDMNQPLYNRILGSYTPGSSMKPITGAIGLSTNTFTANESFGESTKKWQKDDSWKDFYVSTLEIYEGEMNLNNAMVYSDNIYFAKAAIKIGKENFVNGLQKIGFNKELVTPFGNVKSSYSNSETIQTEIDLANSGYGQAEMLINPIHMAMIYSSFINDGNIIKTYLEYKKEPKIEYEIENVFTSQAVNDVKNALIQVIEDENGTAHSAKIEGTTLAGKTGTAEIKNSKDDKNGTELGWFNCFIADENNEEQLLITTMVEDVKGRGRKPLCGR